MSTGPNEAGFAMETHQEAPYESLSSLHPWVIQSPEPDPFSSTRFLSSSYGRNDTNRQIKRGRLG